MKKPNKNEKKASLILFLQFFCTIFFGFCLCNICGIAIHCIFNGFNKFFLQVSELPYLLYLLFSLIISSVLILIIHKKTN